MVNKMAKEGKNKERLKNDKRGRMPRDRSSLFDKESWKPKTSIGMKVKSGEIDSIDYMLDNRFKFCVS